jgi:rhodanese-related sulfurtransferase
MFSLSRESYIIENKIINSDNKPMKLLRTLSLAALLSLSSLSAQAEIINLDNQKTEELVKQGIPVIDVRMKSEWQQTGIIEGSHLLTLFDENGDYDLEKWVADLDKIAGKDKPFILICAVGGRTGMVSQFLDRKLGYSQVHNVSRGINSWIKDGKAVIPYSDSAAKPEDSVVQ